MNCIKYLRLMAKNDKWIALYRFSQEIGNLKMFDNEKELSRIQVIFLNWVATYYSLYSDLANGEDYISENVINDNVRTDAYLLYRQKKYKDKDFKPTDKKDNILGNCGIPKIIFTKNKRDKK